MRVRLVVKSDVCQVESDEIHGFEKLFESFLGGGGAPKRAVREMNVISYTELLICGYMVRLPPNIQPYATQRTMIAKILTSLKNKLNALIESPTGSGWFLMRFCFDAIKHIVGSSCPFISSCSFPSTIHPIIKYGESIS